MPLLLTFVLQSPTYQDTGQLLSSFLLVGIHPFQATSEKGDDAAVRVALSVPSFTRSAELYLVTSENADCHSPGRVIATCRVQVSLWTSQENTS